MTKPENASISEHEHKKLQSHITTIEGESGTHGLINTLKELVIHTIQGKSDKDGNKKKSIIKGAFAPTYSSLPVGNKAIARSLVVNLEHTFGISPQRTNAIREVLTIPSAHKRILMRGLVERLLSKHALVNDRSNTFEAVMLILGSLGPDQQDLANELTQPLIKVYQDDFKKPYINFAGQHFRTADGSYNSLVSPDVGKAGSNYYKAVPSKSPVNEQLPPAHTVFERLLKRPEGQFTPHKSGVNMLLFYLAIVITHDVFYTDRNDPNRNLTTGYLDLSTLYGFNRKDQESIRQMKEGLLKVDQWFDKRFVLQPPGVGAILVLFSRNHNYIAKKLLEINENGRFSFGPGKPLKTTQDVDEELFQTARLINTGCFANVIVRDYIRTILGTSQNSDFFWDPLASPSHPVYGNQVSIEFNIIYRWHAAIGKQDEEWLNTVMATMGPSLRHPTTRSSESKLTSTDDQQQYPPRQHHRKGDGDPNGTDQSIFESLIPIFNTHFAHATEEELEKGLPLAGAHRDPKTGRFDDTDLAKLLRRGYTQVAGEMGNGLATPAALAPVEIAGIMQARQLRCCYFNEFRKFLGLTPMQTFEDFSDKVQVQTALKELYGTPDKVELYVGLLVERSKVVGLRLPYTISRAILSDAVNLLRNDRINTQEMTPANLTNWGFQLTQGEPTQHGRIFPKLINLHLGKANPGGAPAFTDEEADNLFLIPEKTIGLL
ncbi:heme peroxidase [Chlamydoabsidia padenii]|nr:heme peroxidase [Chlamydoabsidia padenii]